MVETAIIIIKHVALKLKFIEIYNVAAKNKKDVTKTKWEPVK